MAFRDKVVTECFTKTLTAGVDAIVGTAGNDTINGTDLAGATGSVLGGLDSINGGAGTDTVNFADALTTAANQFTLGGATLTAVENLNVTTNGTFGKVGTSTFDISGVAGLTNAVLKAAGSANSSVTLGAAQTLDLTVSGAANAVVIGGKIVSVTAGTGTVTVGGAAASAANYTAVSVKGGTGATIDNASAAGTTAAGTTLTTVTLNASNGDNAVKGASLTTVNLSGATSATRTTTVTNGTASHALTLNVDGTGIDSASATSAFLGGGSAVIDTVATALTVNATGTKSSIDVSGASAVKAITITGSAALTLAAAPAAAVLAVDGSAATGALTLGTLNAAVVTLKTGSGNDTATLSATTKATVDTGAGNDTLTLAAALAAGSTITLGAGNDTLLGTAVNAASTATLVTTVNAGDGIDSVSSILINAGNAAQFINFENVSLQGSSLDLALLTGSTITGLSIDAAATTVVLNATTAQSLTVNAGGTSSTIGFANVAGTADAYSITFAGTTTGTAIAPAAVNAGTVVINSIENVAIHSGATAGVNTNSIVLTDSTLQTLTIDGAQAATVAFTGTTGTVNASNVGGVSLIDGSAATGKLNIDVTGGTFSKAVAGITIKGGSAIDSITTGNFASTLTGGAGADTFVVTAAVAGGTSAAAPVFTTITDAAAGDILKFTIGTTNVFNTAKVDVSTATALAQGTVNALDLAVTAAGDTNNQISWFQYGGNTYIIDHAAAGTDLAAADVVVKLVGLIDLSTAAFAEGGNAASTLTLA